MVNPNLRSLDASISELLGHGHSKHALLLYRRMPQEDLPLLLLHHLDPRTLIALLKACGRCRDLGTGLRMHAHVAATGLLETNPFLAGAVVDMYAKCGVAARAEQVFAKLRRRDVVSWTSLMAGFCNSGDGGRALECLEAMVEKDRILPNHVTLVCAVQAASCAGARGKGRDLHEEIERSGLLHRNMFLASALVDMYARFGCIAKAEEVFHRNPILRSEAAWNAIISAYTAHGYGGKALGCCARMLNEGIAPTSITFAGSLKACASLRSAEKGKAIHALLEAQGMSRGEDAVIGSSLVDMYAKCGHLRRAHRVFDEAPLRNTVVWTALVAGYVEDEQFAEALDLFDHMQHEGVSANSITCLCILKACGNLRAAQQGRRVHEDLESRGFLRNDIAVGNAVVGMYAKCGLLDVAKAVLNQLPIRNVVSWTSLMAGCNDHGYAEDALRSFEEMQLQGIRPNLVTFVCALDACGNMSAFDEGIGIHAEIERRGLRERDDSSIGNALVDMYAKCGVLSIGREVFGRLRSRSLVSWTALIAGYAKNGRGDEALRCFDDMRSRAVPPDAITYFWCLKACSLTGALSKGVEMHLDVERQALLENDVILGNALVEMYTKCGALGRAKQAFDKIRTPDMLSWTILIGGYIHRGHGEEAMKCFEQLRCKGIAPSPVLLAYGIKACGMIGASGRAEEIHGEIRSRGLLKKDLVIGNTLLDTYARCGALERAKEVFSELPVRDVVAWTSLMAGYTQIGETDNAFLLFEKMLGEGISPDTVSFLVILAACARKRLLDKSWTYFEAMSRCYGITPGPHHHACVLDAIGRCGHLDQALEMIKGSRLRSDVVLWRGILGSCRHWGNVNLGLEAFEHAKQFK